MFAFTRVQNKIKYTNKYGLKRYVWNKTNIPFINQSSQQFMDVLDTKNVLKLLISMNIAFYLFWIKFNLIKLLISARLHLIYKNLKKTLFEGKHVKNVCSTKRLIINVRLFVFKISVNFVTSKKKSHYFCLATSSVKKLLLLLSQTQTKVFRSKEGQIFSHFSKG